VSLVNEDIVIISEMEVLRNVSMLLERASPRTIQNYLIWRFMMSQTEYMPKRFRGLKQEFNRIFQGINKEKPRKIKCGQYVNAYMGLAVSKLYISKYFDENSRKEVNRLILIVKFQF
jgi:predicted metalloendopeptidase